MQNNDVSAYDIVKLNRAYLKDKEIVTNIDFYVESDKEQKYYGLKNFTISADLRSATCLNLISTEEYTLTYSYFMAFICIYQ